MDLLPGLKAKDVAKAEARAKTLISKFDADGDGVLAGAELQEKQTRTYTTTTRERLAYNEDWVRVTHTDKAEYRRIDEAQAKRYDADHDGKLTAEEMVQAFMQEADRNGDGKVGFWERLFGWRLPKPEGIFERFRTAIVGQRSSLEYDPLPDRPVPPGGSDRPVPPGGDSGGDRPTPPSGS